MSSRHSFRWWLGLFQKYGLGPWVCLFCSALVEAEATGTKSPQVHHKDHDDENNDPNNLAFAHRICHQRHHKKDKPLDPEWAEKIRLGSIGRKHSAETKAKIGASHVGMRHTEATKLRLSASRLAFVSKQKERLS